MKYSDVKVGQEVAISGRHGDTYFGWVVTKISPSGQITASKADGKIVFNPNGDERTSDRWSKRYLHLNVEELRESTRERRARQLTADSINKIFQSQRASREWGKDDLQDKITELQKLLAIAQNALDKI